MYLSNIYLGLFNAESNYFLLFNLIKNKHYLFIFHELTKYIIIIMTCVFLIISKTLIFLLI